MTSSTYSLAHLLIFHLCLLVSVAEKPDKQCSDYNDGDKRREVHFKCDYFGANNLALTHRSIIIL